jgi:uncharacterized protein YcbX
MQISALCRYPIKSHGRESLEKVALTPGQTMPWDRTWAVTHEASKVNMDAPEWVPCQNFMIGTRTPALAGLWARLDQDARRVTLTHQALDPFSFCPDDAQDVARFLAWIAPLCPANRAAPTGIFTAASRGMTDTDYPSVSIMNIASHRAVEQAIGGPLEQERWRGNIWIDGPAAWDEFNWMGRDLRLGDAVLRLREPIKRCAHTTANPVTGLRDADTLGTLERSFAHDNFGVYAEVITGGTLSIGDEVTLL